MRLRVLDFGVDKYGLNAYIFDSTNDQTRELRSRVVLAHQRWRGCCGDVEPGQWGDVKVKIVGGALAGKTAGLLVKVEELTGDLSKVRLFHTSVSRANASWPTWPAKRVSRAILKSIVAQKFPTSTAADFAILESGIVSEETYVSRAFTGRPVTTRSSNTSSRTTNPIWRWWATRRPTSSSINSWA